MANSEQVIHVEMNVADVAAAVKDLDKELLVLRLSFGKLKAAISDAVAPLGAAFIPVVNKAVWAATRLVKTVGAVIAALFGYSVSAEDAKKQQEKLTKSTGRLKRTLMGFDEINRLSGSDGVLESVSYGDMKKLTPQLQALVDRILAIVAPLKEIDFTPAAEAFRRLRGAIFTIGRDVFAGLEWAWVNLLVPLAKWTIEDALPVFLDVLSAALKVFHGVVAALQPMANWLREKFLQPLGQWTGEQVIAALGWLKERLEGISQWVANNQGLVQKITLGAAAIALVNSAVKDFNVLGETAIGRAKGFGGATELLGSPISMVAGGITALIGVITLLISNWEKVKSTASSVWTTVQSVWSGVAGWCQKNVLTPLSNGFKSMVNGVIGFLNSLIAGVVSAVNGMIAAVNKIQFTMPGWVPGFGGKQIGFNLKSVTAPRIPYLAQGAVLPANKPFMAVVGDQRHGTNVEAPLATIQEAVALVMGDQTNAILAGFETSVEVQREILQAVLGIQIGDDVIGSAMARYQRKMAVVNGGVV